MGLSKWLPRGMREKLRQFIKELVVPLAAPQMIWGYTDPRGVRLPRVRISTSAVLYHPEKIVFEDDVFVWHFSILDGMAGLTIGTGTQIGAGVGIFSHSSHPAIRILGKKYTEFEESRKTGFQKAPVSIGKYVFIASGAKILPGVKVGDYAVIGANTVIASDVEPFSIVLGVPARVVGTSDSLDEKTLAGLSPEEISALDQDYLAVLKKRIHEQKKP